MPSNVYWHNKATIRMLPIDMAKYSIVCINKSDNITIDGRIFIGDFEMRIGRVGEWGHGMKCEGTV